MVFAKRLIENRFDFGKILVLSLLYPDKKSLKISFKDFFLIISLLNEHKLNGLLKLI